MAPAVYRIPSIAERSPCPSRKSLTSCFTITYSDSYLNGFRVRSMRLTLYKGQSMDVLRVVLIFVRQCSAGKPPCAGPVNSSMFVSGPILGQGYILVKFAGEHLDLRAKPRCRLSQDSIGPYSATPCHQCVRHRRSVDQRTESRNPATEGQRRYFPWVDSAGASRNGLPAMYKSSRLRSPSFSGSAAFWTALCCHRTACSKSPNSA